MLKINSSYKIFVSNKLQFNNLNRIKRFYSKHKISLTQSSQLDVSNFNHLETDSTICNPSFIGIIISHYPDILIANGMIIQAGVNGFINNVLLNHDEIFKSTH